MDRVWVTNNQIASLIVNDLFTFDNQFFVFVDVCYRYCFLQLKQQVNNGSILGATDQSCDKVRLHSQDHTEFLI